MAYDVVLGRLAASGAHPSATYRQAGDRQVLIEFGDMELDLRLNFFVQSVAQQLRLDPVAGVTECAPGFRSIMVTFEPDDLSRDRLISELDERVEAAPPLDRLRLPSRVVTLPIAFDDEMSREAVHRYRITISRTAPNVRNGDNIDYIVRANGFDTREQFYETFLDATWWNAFVGYFPGLPSLFSMDPLTQIAVPKYNPARMWTSEGTVGLGGPCVVIYPVDAPGSYQVFARTLPVLDLWGRAQGHGADPVLFRVADRVRFERVAEAELLALRRQVMEGTYAYRVEQSELDVPRYLAECALVTDHAARVRTVRQSAATTVEIP